MYKDEFGREYNIHDIQAQGAFYVRPDIRLLIVFTAFGMIAWALLLIFVWDLIWYFSVYIPWLGYVAAVVTQPLAFYHLTTKIRSPIRNYKADGRGFYITCREGNAQIMYKDVISVDYSPTKYLKRDLGYKVVIKTIYGCEVFDYVFPRFNHVIPERDTPFEVIRKNIPPENKEKVV